MILLAVEEWFTRAKLTQQVRSLHFTPGPLGARPEMPAASIVLSPANQNPALHGPHPEPGAWAHRCLRVVFCFIVTLPGNGQSSKHVGLSSQLFLVASLVTVHPGGGFRWN